MPVGIRLENTSTELHLREAPNIEGFSHLSILVLLLANLQLRNLLRLHPGWETLRKYRNLTPFHLLTLWFQMTRRPLTLLTQTSMLTWPWPSTNRND